MKTFRNIEDFIIALPYPNGNYNRGVLQVEFWITGSWTSVERARHAVPLRPDIWRRCSLVSKRRDRMIAMGSDPPHRLKPVLLNPHRDRAVAQPAAAGCGPRNRRRTSFGLRLVAFGR